MHPILTGKKGIITGALDENSIAWKTAEKAHAAGAQILLTNAPVALRMGTVKKLAERLGAELVPADLTNVEDIEKLYSAAQARFGKVDFILHSVGMSPNVRKKRPYTDLNYAWLQQTYDVSAVSFHKMMQTALKMDLMNEWGSIVALSYVAAQRTFPGYNDMTEAKALLESIARTFGYFFAKAKKVRVNTVSQSPTPTTAGTGVSGFDAMLGFAEAMSPLGNATAEECADFVVLLFSDYTRKVTMQNLFHDGGFSSVGVSEEVLRAFEAYTGARS
ncbi:MAG: enoyl-ACP reductase [Bacteroidia bacterium]|nr:enoyl-ACP reductase [Bacteroidia bacterium]MDW8333594.1 enoyl-ACP reductase [Bacteroidia bacterium]